MAGSSPESFRTWRSPRRQAVILLIAFLPTLTFAGHWDVPAFRDFLNASFPGGHSHSAHAHTPAEAHEHARHCHANLASCTDAPATGTAAVAHLSADVARLTALTPFLPVHARAGEPHSPLASVLPQLQPPNA
jgi:hypothetical protein